jgi:hypothetical protein
MLSILSLDESFFTLSEFSQGNNELGEGGFSTQPRFQYMRELLRIGLVGVSSTTCIPHRIRVFHLLRRTPIGEMTDFLSQNG